MAGASDRYPQPTGNGHKVLKNGTLVRAHDLSLPGYGFYLVHLHHQSRQSIIEAFSRWIRAVA